MSVRTSAQRLAFATIASTMLAAPTYAEMSAEELAKLAQNPVGNLISLPFQNNTNFNYGPMSGTQNILNIQPVIPIEISKEWNIITRTIVPVIWQPELSPTIGSKSGIGDTVFSAFLSPAQSQGLIWGSGRWCSCPPTPAMNSATRTGGWGQRSSCSSWNTATRGSMACC